MTDGVFLGFLTRKVKNGTLNKLSPVSVQAKFVNKNLKLAIAFNTSKNLIHF